MKRLLAVLAATCWGAWGQQTPALAGLPEHGVTLTGAVQNPIILNNSGKTIIGHVLHMEDASGEGQYRRNLKTRGLRLNLLALSLSAPLDIGIPPGGLESPLSPLRLALAQAPRRYGQHRG